MPRYRVTATDQGSERSDAVLIQCGPLPLATACGQRASHPTE